MHRNVHALTSRKVYEAMIHERDVRAKIAAVLRNEISVVDFARWIMSNSWNMHKDSSSEAVDLVSNIHLLLAERHDAQSDEAFLQELAVIAGNPDVIDQSQRVWMSVNANVPVRVSLNFDPAPLQSANIRSSAMPAYQWRALVLAQL